MNIKNLLLGASKAEVKIVGVSNYVDTVKRLTTNAVVMVTHEPTNEYDPNAMRVTLDGETVGYLPKVIAERIIKETPDRAFMAHMAYVTKYENNVVGGAIIFDTVTEAREPAMVTPTRPTVKPEVIDNPVF
jgi:hypothetical protein